MKERGRDKKKQAERGRGRRREKEGRKDETGREHSHLQISPQTPAPASAWLKLEPGTIHISHRVAGTDQLSPHSYLPGPAFSKELESGIKSKCSLWSTGVLTSRPNGCPANTF